MADSPAPADWFRAAFDADYMARYAHRDASEAARAVELVFRHTDLRPDAIVFDLCCGAGRHLAAMAAAAPECQVLGGDLSPGLLAAARKLPELHRAGLIRLDMRAIPLRVQSVDLLTNFFTAFGYFESDEENLAVFREVARVLRPGGWFAFDFLNATVSLINLTPPSDLVEFDGRGAAWRVVRRLSPDGRRAVKFQTRQDDGRELWESVRLFGREQIEEGLRAAGLTPVHWFGSYEGQPFQENESPRLIVLARRVVIGK